MTVVRSSYVPNPAAARFHASSAFERFLICGLGYGKTTALVFEGVQLSLANPGCRGLLTEPTFPMVRDILRPAVETVLERFFPGLPYEYRSGDYTFTLPGDRVIQMINRDTSRGLRGSNLAFAAADEVALDDDIEPLNHLAARVRDPRAKRLGVIGAGTPEGKNFFYRRYIQPAEGRVPDIRNFAARRMVEVDGKEIPITYAVYRGATGENPHLPAIYRATLRTKFSTEQLANYESGDFETFGGRMAFWAYGAQNKEPCTYDAQAAALVLTADFNVSPLCASVFLMYRKNCPHTGRERRLFRGIDEIVIPDNATAAMLATLFAERYNRRGGSVAAHQGAVIVCGDSSARKRTTSGSETEATQIRDVLKGQFKEVSMRLRRSNLEHRVSLTNANSAFKDGWGSNWAFVDHRRQPVLHDSLSGTRRTEDDGIVKDGTEHASDAMRYMIDELDPVVVSVIEVSQPGYRSAQEGARNAY